MLRQDRSLNLLLMVGALAIAAVYIGPRLLTKDRTATATLATAQTGGAAGQAQWAAAVPGRVEPKSGEIRITAQAPGRIAEVLAAVNDRVAAGDLLIRLDDSELEARVAAADAEVNVRKRDRDGETGNSGARDRRSAEDAVASAEHLLAQNRSEYDRWVRARKAGNAKSEDVDKARETVTAAKERLEQARAALRKVLAGSGLPLQTRLEAGIAAARAELSLADAALERAHIRAPSNGTVLQVQANVGETATPNPENVLIVVGDLSSLRVRAEVEERDIGKVRIGQTAIVRSDAFPGRDFEGKVATIAQALGSPKLGQKGPRKTTDVDVLEVTIDLAGQPALLSGMRVDVFLKPEATAVAPASAPPAAKKN